MVAPLDWGLGHATRCIPIIHALQKHGARVLLAGDGAVEILLRSEFPRLPFLTLKGYEVTYSKTKGGFFPKLVMQSPKILGVIEHEHKWLGRAIKSHGINAVISDNRFGLWSRVIPCVYITHQLHVHSPNIAMSMLAQKVHYSFINRYRECWVPDYAENGLAGKLSHPAHLPAVPVKYMGPLTRLQKTETKTTLDIFVSLSGPEPQRTLFEKILAPQLKKSGKRVLFLRGLPGESKTSYTDNDVFKMHNHLPAKKFNEWMQKADLVIARAGYSTMMDLTATGQKAILVPTPGQSEQEFLAKYLEEQGIYMAASQEGFNLEKELKKVEKFPFKNALPTGTDLLDTLVKDFLQSISPQTG